MHKAWLAGVVGLVGLTIRVAPAQSQVSVERLLSQALVQTKLFQCGRDQVLEFPIPLRWDTVVLAADGRLFEPCPNDSHDRAHREMREAALLADARGSRDPELRRLGVQALGRTSPVFQTGATEPRPGRGFSVVRRDDGSSRVAPGGDIPVQQVAFLAVALGDPSPRVRQAAAIALGEVVRPVIPEPVSYHQNALRSGPEPLASAVISAARQLEQRLVVETDEVVAGAILASLGGLPYEDDGLRRQIEAVLTSRITEARPAELFLGAIRGIEVLWRRQPHFVPSGQAVERMRAVATHASAQTSVSDDAPAGTTLDDADVLARARRVAILSLARSGLDEATALRAARDLDWQVRRVAVATLSPASGPSAEALGRALRDPAFQVRFEAVRVLGRYATESRECGSLISTLDDGSPLVAMAALDALTPDCADLDDWLPRVVDLAATLERSESWTAWHAPARALAALARVLPERVPAAIRAAGEHPVWQVRATVAEVARLLKAPDIAIGLGEDRHPNVRAAALDVLRELDSPARFDMAREALRSPDFRLIQIAAQALAGVPDHQVAVTGLIQRLNELGNQAWDTSRQARVAMVERLGELLDPSQASSLSRYIDDFDPYVSLAATVAFMRLTGTSQRPVPRPLRRYPYQPGSEALSSLPRHAMMKLDGGGIVQIEFLLDVAPVTVARFAELVEARYFDGLTFHGVDPNFAVHAGSPGENASSGISRFMRDEVGASHVRGTFGMATNGHDTGNGLFFINLVDNPNLDRDYTVFARVISGMAAVDAILPGTRIESISVR